MVLQIDLIAEATDSVQVSYGARTDLYCRVCCNFVTRFLV